MSTTTKESVKISLKKKPTYVYLCIHIVVRQKPTQRCEAIILQFFLKVITR